MHDTVPAPDSGTGHPPAPSARLPTASHRPPGHPEPSASPRASRSPSGPGNSGSGSGTHSLLLHGRRLEHGTETPRRAAPRPAPPPAQAPRPAPPTGHRPLPPSRHNECTQASAYVCAPPPALLKATARVPRPPASLSMRRAAEPAPTAQRSWVRIPVPEGGR